jgi:hypothetical protein
MNGAVPIWHVVAVAGPDDGTHEHRLELVRGEADAAEHAYVDVVAFEDRHGDAHIEVLGTAWAEAGCPVSESAADALRYEAAHAEQALAWAVMDGAAYVLAGRRAA